MNDADTSDLGEGLVYEDTIPVDWRELGELPGTARILSAHQSNEQLLRYIVALDEHRPDSSTDDERGQLAQEVARLEFKLNLVLDMLGRLLSHDPSIPVPVPIRMSGIGLQWQSARPTAPGRTLSVDIYLNRKFPNPITLFGEVTGVEPVDDGFLIEMHYREMTDPVRNWIEKMIFRQHRRLVAHSRQAARGPDPE